MVKKNVSVEDSELFRQAIGKVKRVKTDKILPQKNHPVKKMAKPQLAKSDVWERDLANEEDPVSHEQAMSFSAPGLQKNVLTKLRKGFFVIDGELDLHGYSTNAAQQLLLRFLNISIGAGHRCVHIIHGKGYHSSEEMPVLKNHLNLWLRRHSAVQAFCSTPQRYGGTGAVWVLLKTTLSRD